MVSRCLARWFQLGGLSSGEQGTLECCTSRTACPSPSGQDGTCSLLAPGCACLCWTLPAETPCHCSVLAETLPLFDDTKKGQCYSLIDTAKSEWKYRMLHLLCKCIKTRCNQIPSLLHLLFRKFCCTQFKGTDQARALCDSTGKKMSQLGS